MSNQRRAEEVIDQYAKIIKDVATEFQTEVDSLEEATTTIYDSIISMAESVRRLSDTVVAAVSKTFDQSEESDGPKEEGPKHF